jgi:fatty acid-binding protein DegV
LAASRHLDPAQAIVGEMLGITPFFILENGQLTPIQKARSSRHLVDQLHEFVAEFDDLKHVAIIQGTTPLDQDARTLRDRLNGVCRGACLSEHTIGTSVAALFGPRSLGVIVMEKTRAEFL